MVIRRGDRYVCEFCGLSHTTHFIHNCRATCRYLGEPTGENLPRVRKRGCKSAAQTTAVFSCELHSRCTVLADAGISFCEKCTDRRN